MCWVLSRRRKFATVLYAPLAYQFDIDLRDLDTHGAVVSFRRRSYRARLRETAKARKRLGLSCSKRGVKRALELLS